jgi:hypothetical protein
VDSKPASVTHEISGKVFHYIQVDKNDTTADSKINRTIIRFEVNKTWITDNSVNKSSVALLRYTNTWNKLQTTELSDDGQVVLYEAISPGLSVFAIAAVVGENVSVPIQQTTEEGNQTTPQETAETEGKGKTSLVITIILIVLVAAGAIFYLVKRGTIKLDKIIPRKSGSNWDDLRKKYSRR